MSEFERQDKHKNRKLSGKSWRSPRGKHSKVRLEKKHAPKKPKIGYRSSRENRGKHPSGFEDVLVNNPSDVEEIDPETEAARISSKVGGRKREKMIEKADELDVKVLNRGDHDE